MSASKSLFGDTIAVAAVIAWMGCGPSASTTGRLNLAIADKSPHAGSIAHAEHVNTRTNRTRG